MSTRHRATGGHVRPPLLAVAHGTRDPRGQTVVHSLLEAVRAMRPDLHVRLAYVDVQAPTVAESLAEQTSTSDSAPPPVVVPLLLSAGQHVSADIPNAAAEVPGTVTAAPLGPDPVLARVLCDRLEEQGPKYGCSDTVVLAAAGSSHAEGRADAERAAGLLQSCIRAPVICAYAAAARPSIGESVAVARSRGARRVAVATYLTGRGHFADSINAAARDADAATSPLAPDQRIARLILQRYDTARVASCYAESPPAPV